MRIGSTGSAAWAKHIDWCALAWAHFRYLLTHSASSIAWAIFSRRAVSPLDIYVLWAHGLVTQPLLLGRLGQIQPIDRYDGPTFSPLTRFARSLRSIATQSLRSHVDSIYTLFTSICNRSSNSCSSSLSMMSSSRVPAMHPSKSWMEYPQRWSVTRFCG